MKRLRSYVIKQYPLEQAVRARAWNAQPDMKQVTDHLYQVGLQHKHYEPVSQIAAGDIVAVRLESDVKKYNRLLKLQVGGNLFDKELETALIGRNAGESGELRHTVGRICYTVESVQRLVVPTVTDEMAVGVGVDGVTTAEQLKEHYLDESLRKALGDEVYEFIPDFLRKWEFCVVEEDLLEMDEHEMERCRGISRSMGKVFDEMTEQELLGAVGCHNIPEFRSMIHEYHGKSLRAALVEAALIDRSAQDIRPEDVNELYWALVDQITQAAVNTIKEKS